MLKELLKSFGETTVSMQIFRSPRRTDLANRPNKFTCASFTISRLPFTIYKSMTIDEQIEFLKKGAVDLIREDDLRKKLERSATFTSDIL